MARSWPALALVALVCFLQAQQTEAVTEPAEVAALLTMKAAWQNVTRLSSWNDTSDPCDDGWRGIICSLASAAGNRHVTGIQIPGFWVGGTLSPAVGTLTSLTLLDLNSNNMTGPMPAEIVNLNQVQRFVFRGSRITGTLDTWLPKLSTLRIVDMGNNLFSGPIPDEIGTSLKTLQVFDCSFCQLSGPLPASLGSLGSLQLLQLPHNNFTGEIPVELGKLGSLQGLNLQNNSLTGTFPEEIGALTNLNQLIMAYNQLTGLLPESVLTNAATLMRFDGNPLCDIAANAPFCTGAPLPSTGGPGGPAGGGPNGLGTLPGGGPGGLPGGGPGGAVPGANATTPGAGPAAANQTLPAAPLPQPAAAPSIQPAAAPEPSPVAAGTTAAQNQSGASNQTTGTSSVTGQTQPGAPAVALGNTGSKGSSTPVGAIVGVAAGGAAFLALVALLVAMAVSRKKARRPHSGLLGAAATSKTTSTTGSDNWSRSVGSRVLRALHLGSPHQTLPVEEAGAPAYFAAPGAVEGMEAPLLFTFRELQAITDGFNDSLLIGEGGFGKVYRADMKDQAVAVKRLEKTAAFPGKHGEKQFRTEVDVLSRIRHPNLLGLIGYCADGGERALVYPLMANQSLHTQLHDRKVNPALASWRTRLTIAVQSARALAYLHDEASPPVIHRDFTSSNVLLDGDWTAVVSDFGLAKLLPQAGTPTATQSTRLHGTLGYLAPEYLRGQVTEKNDVYSFGVVLLELLSGRRALVSEQFDLVHWAASIIKGPPPILDKILDLSIKTDIPLAALQTAIRVAASCVDTDPKRRPRMADVVRTLGAAMEEAYGPDANPARSDPVIVTVGGIGQVPEEAAVQQYDDRSTGSFDYRMPDGTASKASTGSIDVSGEERAI